MTEQLSFPQALNLAMTREMESDPSVFVFGVDAQDPKRTFGSGEGMIERFGKRRYFGSPVAEAGSTGVAIGAALCGLRPIQIHQRADFMLLAMNQLVNMASIKSFVSSGVSKVPLVVRAVIGRGWGQGPQHSKSMHSVFAHFPGLKVILPASPQDGYSLLRSAIRDDDPVIFLEHRWLYDIVGEVDEDLTVPIGKCRVKKEGQDLTIVGASWMAVESTQAASILAEHGVNAEVIDVRTVSPLDLGTITTSVQKTGRVIIADYDWTSFGLASEIAARVTESCFDSLKAAPVRIGFAPVPTPVTRVLEDMFYPSAKHIVRAAEKLLKLPEIDLSGEIFNEYEQRFKGPF